MSKDTEAGIAMAAGVVITLLFVILISTTSKSDIFTIAQIEQAQEVCANNGGLRYIQGRAGGDHTFHCANSARFTYDPDKE